MNPHKKMIIELQASIQTKPTFDMEWRMNK